MDKVLQCVNNLQERDNYYYGYVDSPDSLDDLLERYRQVTGLYFPTATNRSRLSDSGAHFSNENNKRPMFLMNGKVPIDFCGTPFTAERTIIKSCMFGKDTKAKEKEKNKSVNQTINEHQYQAPPIKKKPRHQTTKKKDCRAQIVIKEVCMYPMYSIDLNEYNSASTRVKRVLKQQQLEKLSLDIKAGSITDSFERFYFKLPTDGAHDKHEVGNLGDLLAQPIHEKVRDKIHDLVSEGMVNPRIIRLQLKDYVELVLLREDGVEVDRCNSSYYPELKTIADHVRLALRAQRYGKMDQAALADLAEKLKKDS